MSVTTIHALLRATQRHLWRQQLGTAIRRGLWGSAGAGLAAAAWHLTGGPAAAIAWAGITAAWCTGWLAWVLVQRPTDLDAALWADRHLGGASALSTWLGIDQAAPQPSRPPTQRAEAGPQPATDARAAAWLGDWLQARVPALRQQLAAQPRGLGLTRPLAATLVCAALAGFVLTGVTPATPGPSAAAAAAAASSAQAAGQASPADPGATAAASAPALVDLAGELSRTLRAPPLVAPTSLSAGAPNAATPSRQAAGSRPDEAAPLGSALAPGRALPAAAPAKPVDGRDPALTATPATPQAVAGTGRGAGTSVDSDAPAPSARPPLPAMVVRGVPVADRDQPPQRQADMAQAGTYDDLHALRRVAPDPLPAAAAALAPTAGVETRLSPTEASYVQAWMKAMTRPGR